MNNTKFFNHLRQKNSGVFGSSLSQKQVDGINSILAVASEYPLAYVAYALATTYGETGRKMQPTTENLRYTTHGAINRAFSSGRRQGKDLRRNPELLANTVYGGDWGLLNLGNTKPGDGWKYRGRGLPQTTGRANYEKLAAITGIDLVNFPEKMLNLDIAVRASLFEAMDTGIYTGKSFRDYLPKTGHATHKNFVESRRIVNGVFKADDYADWAVSFQTALVKAGFETIVVPVIPIVETPTVKGWLEMIMEFLSKWK